MVGGDIDFLILDTMHKMPGEILDFLACYPFLKKGAVVVLHDIALCHHENNWDAIATKLLFDTVTADKLIGIDEEDSSLLNIGAFVVTKDTGQYIDDVFSALTTIWGYRVKDKELAIYREFPGILCMVSKIRKSISPPTIFKSSGAYFPVCKI